MKIVHISTYPNGGAGNATLRMHKSLLLQGVDSKVITRSDTLGEEGVLAFNDSIWFRRFSTLWKLFKTFPYNYKVDKDCEGFSNPISLFRIHEHQVVKEADVIIIQWVSNFIDYQSFFNEIDKPIYLYLHDMNHFLGGFHYEEDIKCYPALHKAENLFVDIKRQAYQNKNIEVLAPSQWMIDSSKESDLLSEFDHHKMYYGLDEKIIKNYPQEEARNFFSLPKDGKVLLFVSEKISNRRKGATILIEALQRIKFSDDISILVVGNYDKSIFNSKNLYTTGVLRTEKEMAMAYSASDLFILPSREDNMPNVMLESLYCGTPVMSFMNGGMKEILNESNGILIPEMTSEALAEAIESWIESPISYDRENIRKEITNTFNLKSRGEALKTLIEKRLQTI